MKKSIFLFSLIALAVAMTNCKLNLHRDLSPSKEWVTKKYSVTPFKSIESNVPVSIVFTQADIHKVEAQGPENYVGHLVISTKDSTLSLKMDDPKINFRSLKKNGITLSVSAPTLSRVVHKGIGVIHLKGGISLADLDIFSNGVGDIRSDSLRCNRLTVLTNGVGDITMKGEAAFARYTSNGVGNMHVERMIAREVEATLEGVGSISCFAGQRVTATSKGVGNIDIYGNPESKELNKRGIGSIRER